MANPNVSKSPFYLPDLSTAVTQSGGDNSTKVATTAYVDAAIGGSAAGSAGDVQFNIGGAFTADSNFNWNNTTKRLGLGGAPTDGRLQITVASTEKGIDIVNTGTAQGIMVTHTDTGTGASIEIDRNGNNASDVTGMVINVANAGAGGVIGLHIVTGGLKLNSGVAVVSILDEDNMASDSATALATQQSIKAYVDSQVGAHDTLAEILATGNSSGGTNLVMTAGDTLTSDTINGTTSASSLAIAGVTFAGGTNTFSLTNGTASLDVAAGATVNIDASLAVESASAINQDVTTDATPQFAYVQLNNTPTADNHAATKGYVDSVAQGLDWQASVEYNINYVKTTTGAPTGTPSTGERCLNTFDDTLYTESGGSWDGGAACVSGDRYIFKTSGTDTTGNSGTFTADNKIREYNGVTFDETIANEGMAVWIEDEDVLYVFDGTNWVVFGSTISHNDTTGLQGGTASEYYHLTSAKYTVLTTNSLTASRLASADGSGNLATTDLSTWVAGTTNQVTVTDDTDGTITLSLPQSIHTGAAPQFAGLTLTGNLVMSDNSITGVNTITFTDVNGTIAGIENQNLVDKSSTEVITGSWDFGGAGSLEIPNSASPTVDADGEIAIDTTVTDFTNGIITYYSGAQMGVVAMPIAQFTSPTDGYVVTYNGTTNQFELTSNAALGNTLDQAYDQGGAGAGRTITADSGAVEISAASLGGDDLLAVSHTASGAITSNTTDIVTVSSSRTLTAAGTPADDYELASITRTTVSNHASASITSTGSVLRLENVVTETLGTVADTADVLRMVQSANSTGKGIFMDHNANSIAIDVDHDDTGATASVNINRSGNNASDIAGLVINVANAGAGAAIGLQIQTGFFALNSGVSVNKILDEDTMSSDDATALATQQSIKAYVDSKIGTENGYSATVGTGGDYADIAAAVAGVGGTNIRLLMLSAITEDSAVAVPSGGNLLINTNSFELNMATYQFTYTGAANVFIKGNGMRSGAKLTFALASAVFLFANTAYGTSIVAFDGLTIDNNSVTAGGYLADSVQVYRDVRYELPDNGTAAIALSDDGSFVDTLELVGGGTSCTAGIVASNRVSLSNIHVLGTWSTSAAVFNYGNNFPVTTNVSFEHETNATSTQLEGKVTNVSVTGTQDLNVTTATGAQLTNIDLLAGTFDLGANDQVQVANLKTTGLVDLSDVGCTNNKLTNVRCTTAVTIAGDRNDCVNCDFLGGASVSSGADDNGLVGCQFGPDGGGGALTLTIDSGANRTRVGFCRSDADIVNSGTDSELGFNSTF